jgi:hypothetical protein
VGRGLRTSGGVSLSGVGRGFAVGRGSVVERGRYRLEFLPQLLNDLVRRPAGPLSKTEQIGVALPA